jgi:hypothetical protein
MKNNLNNLEKQLAGLVERSSPPHPKGIVWTERLVQAERDGLAPDERIVEDYYDDAEGETVIIRERITAEPTDKGKTSSTAPGTAGIWTPSIATRL